MAHRRENNPKHGIGLWLIGGGALAAGLYFLTQRNAAPVAAHTPPVPVMPLPPAPAPHPTQGAPLPQQPPTVTQPAQGVITPPSPVAATVAPSAGTPGSTTVQGIDWKALYAQYGGAGGVWSPYVAMDVWGDTVELRADASGRAVIYHRDTGQTEPLQFEATDSEGGDNGPYQPNYSDPGVQQQFRSYVAQRDRSIVESRQQVQQYLTYQQQVAARLAANNAAR